MTLDAVESKASDPANDLPAPNPPASFPAAMIVVITAVLGCSLYANLSLSRNHNDHLGAEYYSIAGALFTGRGYADPFHDQTGPTAWMPPVLPVILAGLRWSAGGRKEVVTALFVLLQDLTLIGTGMLLLVLARQTIGQVRIATAAFLIAIIYHFRLTFQFTHDCFIILAALDLLIGGLVWLRPMQSSRLIAAGWGVFGGLCALTSPVVGFTWGMSTLATGWHRGRRGRLVFAVLLSIVTITPWVARNYAIFGRIIPVKSNLSFELYQSQCLTLNGVLRGNMFSSHPFSSNNVERQEYKRLGEMAYLDRKWELFRESIRASPIDFVERVSHRFLAATFLYHAYDPDLEMRRPWVLWLRRLTYPLPFLCLLLLVTSTFWRRLSSTQWIVIGVYLAYLIPYVLVSYYDRYKYPVFVAEVALIMWTLDRMRLFFGRNPPEETGTLAASPAISFGCSSAPKSSRPLRASLAGKPDLPRAARGYSFRRKRIS